MLFSPGRPITRYSRTAYGPRAIIDGKPRELRFRWQFSGGLQCGASALPDYDRKGAAELNSCAFSRHATRLYTHTLSPLSRNPRPQEYRSISGRGVGGEGDQETVRVATEIGTWTCQFTRRSRAVPCVAPPIVAHSLPSSWFGGRKGRGFHNAISTDGVSSAEDLFGRVSAEHK